MHRFFEKTELVKNLIYIAFIIASVFVTQVVAYNDYKRDVKEIQVKLDPTVKDSYAQRIIENSVSIQELKLIAERLVVKCESSDKISDNLMKSIDKLNEYLKEIGHD